LLLTSRHVLCTTGTSQVLMVEAEPVRIKRKTPPPGCFGATFRAGGLVTTGGEPSDAEFEPLRRALKDGAREQRAHTRSCAVGSVVGWPAPS
jgi:hypothetical protein